MKISVEPAAGFNFDPESGEAIQVPAVRVEWQKTKGGKREHATIITEATEPAAMLEAAAAYFKSQEIPF